MPKINHLTHIFQWGFLHGMAIVFFTVAACIKLWDFYYLWIGFDAFFVLSTIKLYLVLRRAK